MAIRFRHTLPIVLACTSSPPDADGGIDAGLDAGNETSADVSVETDAGADAKPEAGDATADVTPPVPLEWILPLNMTGNRQAAAADSSGNIIITGMQNNPTSIFFKKLDPSGNVVWDKLYSDGFDGSGLAVDSSDNVLLVGSSITSTFNVGGSTLGVGSFVAKFTPGGAHVWSKTLVGLSGDTAPRVVLAPSDGLIAAGRLNGTYAIAGGSSESGSNAVYVVKLASNGSVTWTKTFGSGSTEPRAMTPDGAGGAFFVGDGAICGAGGTNYVAHIDSGGSCTAVTFGDYLTAPLDVVVDPTGNVFVTAQATPGSSVCSGSTFSFIVRKLTSSLTTVWSKCVSGGVNPGQSAATLVADDAGNIAVAGLITGTLDASIDLGGGSITTAGPFVARFETDGGFLTAKVWPAPMYMLPLEMAHAPAQDVYLLGVTSIGTFTIGDASVSFDSGGFIARRTP